MSNEEIKCDDCEEIIEEGDQMWCEGSAQDGLTLCSCCWYDFKENRDGTRCTCEDCYESAYSSHIDCRIDDMRMGDY
jgi:hypothetical protein